MGSVWFEEISTGLLDEIRRTVRDDKGKPLSDKALTVRKPEEDFKFETFPCITISNRNYQFNYLRHYPHPIPVMKEGVMYLENHVVPFDLEYQIDFWSRYQTDMDAMTRTWLVKHFKQFNIPVIDDKGNKRDCNAMTDGRVLRYDLVLDEKRLFHSVLNLNIWVEIDDDTVYNTNIVEEIVANVKGEIGDNHYD